jgi:hypothetical protein
MIRRMALVADRGGGGLFPLAGRDPMTKSLTKEERAQFFRLSRACADRDQVRRLTARLKLNRFVIIHGKETCQAAWDSKRKT